MIMTTRPMMDQRAYIQSAVVECNQLREAKQELIEALDWALPILEKWLEQPETIKAMTELKMTAEPNLSNARATLAKYRD